MATHSNILAWRIPWTEEPGGLQSMGSQRVRQDGATEDTQHLRGSQDFCGSCMYSKLRAPDLSKRKTIFWRENKCLWHRIQGLFGGRLLWWGLEMTTLKQCLFLVVSRSAWLWRHPECCVFTYVTIVRPRPHAWLWTLKAPRDCYYRVSLSCYNVSPNHTHRQDTITDMQCGCPFVWFMGDVVANVASVSFRGSGKLQIFPSQQEVQT